MSTRRISGSACLLALAMVCAASAQVVLWHNGELDGVIKATSHLDDPRRSIMNDFVVAEPAWIVTDFQTLGIWYVAPPGFGVGVNLALYENIADPGFGEAEGPGDLIQDLATFNYSETVTGRFWHGRY
ncbi:MAG: hypothetical protein KKB50_09850 [Planctomycetes bacterium]|nr:hypothetical protein [Planctomycetota bacterium]